MRDDQPAFRRWGVFDRQITDMIVERMCDEIDRFTPKDLVEAVGTLLHPPPLPSPQTSAAMGHATGKSKGKGKGRGRIGRGKGLGKEWRRSAEFAPSEEDEEDIEALQHQLAEIEVANDMCLQELRL
ncbi:hypothetical protein AK812_SmicGene1833 [Symbiodinium microadriaticum]|uniref:Uncharacterized protein n=1 Tax=Symbiodinium microadriaticum TaxID=2951 RepID=A0A1Q9F396_SYMMI|nr:hypothetical protein AK812_SmicGene1833 [Symbiodinium microadriaticum]